jgi:hypothetical protein
MPYYGAIQNPSYLPAVRDVIAITNAFPASVTTSFDHNYLSGLIVRMIVPGEYGMFQINKIKGSITVTSPTTFTIPINTTNFDTFVVPTEQPQQPLGNVAQAVPVGEDSDQLDQSFVNVLTPQF